jgi:hypothetical protein
MSLDPIIEALKYKIANDGSSADAMNMMGQVLYGDKHVPIPAAGEDISDAIRKRNLLHKSFKLQGDSVANNPLFQGLGISKHPLVNAASHIAPEYIGDKLSPLLNGNPAKAAKGITEGLNDPKVLGAFGRISPASEEEARGTIEALKQNFYRNQPSEADGNAKTSSEKLLGGAADGLPDSRYPKKELKKGIKHETEHTGNKAIAKEIAKDHLEERRNYYTLLAKTRLE